uniref:Protein phosphatase 1 regulatory subunit 7 n=1 Tax=Oryza punctata TaxID=4537 RepID=A0A0E0JXP3_ORYPU
MAASGDPVYAAAAAGEAMEVEVEAERCLDLTSCQLHDLSEVEIPPTLEELDLTANRLAAVDPRVGRLPGLRKLSFRQNLLDDAAVAPLSTWADIAGLQELVFRDNKLTTIPDASIFKGLLVFDVSFNEISSLKGLSKVSSTLKELYVSKNEVAKMEELEHFHALQILELGSNRLRECIALEELYLSHNGIQKLEGLSSLQNLRVLDVSSNKLTAIEDVETLSRLEDLWLNDNQIPSLDGIESALASSRERLTTIYLERNPCAKTPNYSSTLKKIFPNLEQLDSDMLA